MNSAEGYSESFIGPSAPEERVDSQPWQGEPSRLYPADEVRDAMRGQISDTLRKHIGGTGILASELADEIARSSYGETGEVIFNNGDVTLEISRMWGTSIRMAPNRRLYPK